MKARYRVDFGIARLTLNERQILVFLFAQRLELFLGFALGFPTFIYFLFSSGQSLRTSTDLPSR